jgi:hypothetical protein
MLGEKQALNSALAMILKAFYQNKSWLKPHSAIFRIPSMNAGVGRMKALSCDK